MTTSTEVLAALDSKRDAERQLAAATVCPPWRHALFAMMMGGFVASPAIALPLRFAFVAVLLGAIPVIMHSDRKRMGMFVNGYRKGNTRLVALGLLAVEMGLYAIGVWRSIAAHDHVTPLLLGVVGFGAGYLGSILWQRVFVRELNA